MRARKSKDIVYDLGAGDGKIAIAAGKLGATSIGIEFNPDMARLAQCFVRAEKLTDRTRIVQGDVFESDFRDATVVTLYLRPELNLRLLPKLLKDLKPGTRIVSHAFTMGSCKPEQTLDVARRSVSYWVIPAPGTPSYEAALAASRSALSVRQRAAERITHTEAASGSQLPRFESPIANHASATAAMDTFRPGIRTGSFAPWRAGGSTGNHLNHSSFIPANSSSSAITTVALTILSMQLPASSRIAWMLVRHWRVCSWMVVPLKAPVTGSVGAVPETKTRPAALTAWLYAAGGFAALGV